jgi:hypothetical protein
VARMGAGADQVQPDRGLAPSPCATPPPMSQNALAQHSPSESGAERARCPLRRRLANRNPTSPARRLTVYCHGRLVLR